MINHRGPEFKALLHDLEEGLRWAFQTKGDLLIFPASGTGGLESAIANLISPGERILAVTIGAFGDRFADLAEAFGAQVQRYAVPWGQAADPEDLDVILAQDPNIHTVLLTHNETSTGVANPVRELVAVIKRHGRLVVLDGVSSVGSINLPVDDWGIDVAVTASQKGWMVPPGVSMLSVGPAAWERQQQARAPRFYFDWTRARKMQAEGATFTTPTISVLFGLREALAMMREEGLPAVFRRHLRLAAAFRAVVEALNLTILASPDAYSPTVTAVWLPENLRDAAANQFQRTLREKYNLVVAGGQGPLHGKIFRIGHMGAVSEQDVLATANALEHGLRDHGYQVEPGAAVAAGQRGLDADEPAMIA
jgi:aspartate aminotransferase-like enzyme